MAFCLRFRLWFEVFLCMFSLSSSFASIFIARFPFAFFCSLLLFRIRMIRFFRCTNQYAIWRLGRIPIYNKFKCEGMKTHALFFYCFIRLLLSMFDCVWRAEWGSVDLVGLNLLLYIAFFFCSFAAVEFYSFYRTICLPHCFSPSYIHFLSIAHTFFSLRCCNIQIQRWCFVTVIVVLFDRVPRSFFSVPYLILTTSLSCLLATCDDKFCLLLGTECFVFFGLHS